MTQEGTRKYDGDLYQKENVQKKVFFCVLFE